MCVFVSSSLFITSQIHSCSLRMFRGSTLVLDLMNYVELSPVSGSIPLSGSWLIYPKVTEETSGTLTFSPEVSQEDSTFLLLTFSVTFRNDESNKYQRKTMWYWVTPMYDCHKSKKKSLLQPSFTFNLSLTALLVHIMPIYELKPACVVLFWKSTILGSDFLPTRCVVCKLICSSSGPTPK